MKFKIKIGIVGLIIPIAVIISDVFYHMTTSLGWRPSSLIAISKVSELYLFYPLVLILFPVLWFFPILIELAGMIFIMASYSLGSVYFLYFIASISWFWVGYVIGATMEDANQKYIKAVALLICFAAIGIYMSPVLEGVLDQKEKLNRVELKQQSQIKLWCTEEMGIWPLDSFDSRERKPQGVPESVRICNDTYVISGKSNDETLQFYFDQRQVFNGVCSVTKNPSGCRKFSHCGKNLCNQFR